MSLIDFNLPLFSLFLFPAAQPIGFHRDDSSEEKFIPVEEAVELAEVAEEEEEEEEELERKVEFSFPLTDPVRTKFGPSQRLPIAVMVEYTDKVKF